MCEGRRLTVEGWQSTASPDERSEIRINSQQSTIEQWNNRTRNNNLTIKTTNNNIILAGKQSKLNK